MNAVEPRYARAEPALLVSDSRVAEARRSPCFPCFLLSTFLRWTVPYATEMVKALEPLNPTWMEGPIPPERIGGLSKIRQAAKVPVATGEHVYTRWQVKELLVGEAVDVLQTDPDWTGGITELTKICALASACLSRAACS